MGKKTEIAGKATLEQIEIWKKQYGEVYEIEVEGHYGYIREFDRETMKYALSQLKIKVDADKKDEKNVTEIDMEKIVNIGEIGLQNCWLGGDELLRTNGRLSIAASMIVGELFDIAEGNLKKL
ncbi:MAG: hypothetical protein FWC10_01920 [Lentimicrobiaceae bacterium]|nr:hypothetical protein [Lentimicrobiaceae bacterium]